MIARIRRRLLGHAAAAADVAFNRATEALAGGRRAAPLPHAERMRHLAEIAAAYPADAPGFFRGARRIEPAAVAVPDLPGASDLSWPSDYVPYTPAVSSAFERGRENRVVHARLLKAHAAAAPRPAVVLVHGYLGGNFAVERRVFPVDRFIALGMDVVLFTLPFHGLRAEPARRVPRFPGADPRVTLEGFRQAAGDLLDLLAWLRRSGHRAAGLMGMSLGGYTTSLLATLDPDLAFAVPMIPLASFSDWARDHGRLSTGPGEADREHAALERAYRLVSPLDRAPLLEGERVLVLAAENDRITPPRHAERLAMHFAAPRLTFPGGHLLQFGRSGPLSEVEALFGRLGLLEPRGGHTAA